MDQKSSIFFETLHEQFCNYEIMKDEVTDVESAVLEGLAKILKIGETLPLKDLIEVSVCYGDLFNIESILPVGSFYQDTKITLPNEFDYNIEINVGEFKIIPEKGCRPGRVQIEFEKDQYFNDSKSLSNRFSEMIVSALESLTEDEKRIKRQNGSLAIKDLESRSTLFGIPCLQTYWTNSFIQFSVTIDILLSIPCPKDLVNIVSDEKFPQKFSSILEDIGCYLVPKKCSHDCQKCFHVSYAREELFLMKNLDGLHRVCYRILKWMLCVHLMESYKLKMAILFHVHDEGEKCTSQLDECIIAILNYLLARYDALEMPGYFTRSSCLISKDGEGKPGYLDFLVDADGLDISEIPAMETHFTEKDNIKDYGWLFMFVWYEFQRRCISLLISILQISLVNDGDENVERSLEVIKEVLKALFIFRDTSIGTLPLFDDHKPTCFTNKPTSREWIEKVPEFSRRVFIPTFSLLVLEIQSILKKPLSKEEIYTVSPIAFPYDPNMFLGYSQGSVGSAILRKGESIFRQGAVCCIAKLENGDWVTSAFGQMSFIDNMENYMEHFFGSYKACGRLIIIRGRSNENPNLDDQQLPVFEGPFHHNVCYDGEAFMVKIVQCWYYYRCLVRFLVRKMLYALSRFPIH